jgi:hypothetical protein
MSLVEINWKPGRRELALFSRAAAAALALAGTVIALRTRAWSAADPLAGWRVPLILAAAAVLVGIAGLVSPRALRPLHLAWMGLTWPIALAATNLLVAAAFYLVLTPVGIAMRLGGRDALRLRRTPGGPAWIPREGAREPRRYLRQY